MIKSRRMTWVGHVAGMVNKRNIQKKTSVGTPEEEPLERSRPR
jgi:hypothetical protein